ncbi:MAG: NAD(P)-dependent oxidoreductase [Hasllibacter sp.]
MTTVLFTGPDKAWDTFGPAIAAAVPRAVPGATVTRDADPADADWVVLGDVSEATDFAAFRRARAILCLWAGVEDVLAQDPPQPVARMVDPGLTQGMVEWVAGHVLRHHLNLDQWIAGPHPGWHRPPPPLAGDRKVGVLGLGALGGACAAALAGLGFDVAGWSRAPKDIPGVQSMTGEAGLRAVLGRSEILVLLTPHTAATEGLMDAANLARMPEGSVLLNPGRGALVDEGALLAALDRGRPAHATLDTFRTEPLPEGHPFWTHPRVTVTPHIASATRAATAAEVIAENVRRGEAGEPLLHLVDRARGY